MTNIFSSFLGNSYLKLRLRKEIKEKELKFSQPLFLIFTSDLFLEVKQFIILQM